MTSSLRLGRRRGCVDNCRTFCLVILRDVRATDGCQKIDGPLPVPGPANHPGA